MVPFWISLVSAPTSLTWNFKGIRSKLDGPAFITIFLHFKRAQVLINNPFGWAKFGNLLLIGSLLILPEPPKNAFAVNSVGSGGPKFTRRPHVV